VEENSASKKKRKLSFLSREQVAKTRNQCCHLEEDVLFLTFSKKIVEQMFVVKKE
jgi:hypothetical protein